MKSLTIHLLTLSVLIFFNLPDAVAQNVVRVHFHLTATMQEPTAEGVEQTFREKVTRINNAKLLELLGAATTNDFTGADLLANTATTGFLVVKGTNVLAYVPTLLSRTGTGAGGFVVRGRQSSDGSVNVRRNAVWQYEFMFGNQEQAFKHAFTFWAHEGAKIVTKTAVTNLPSSYFERSHAYGFGRGFWNMRPAVFNGTVKVFSQPGDDALFGSGFP